jgi:lysine 2,3-aminomutase
MGYLPGSRPRAWSATPRSSASAGCTSSPDTTGRRGITYWTKNYRTGIEADDPAALTRRYEYYDPVYTLPESGRSWWRSQPKSA